MPRPRQTTPIVIDTEQSGAPRLGLRGRIDRLFVEYSTKAQALRLTADILDEDDRRQAVANAPKKFLHAMNHRNESAGRETVKPRRANAAEPKERSPIHGKRLSLFLLEHLNEDEPRDVSHLVEQLAAAGSPVKSTRALNGPLCAVLVKRGYVKKFKEGTMKRTPKGSTFAAELRSMLVARNDIAPGGYLKPAN